MFEAFQGNANIALIPTITGMSDHTGGAGTRVHIAGYGLYHTRSVTVVGHAATTLVRHANTLDARVPAGSGSGWIVVVGNGGTSQRTDAAAFSYS